MIQLKSGLLNFQSLVILKTYLLLVFLCHITNDVLGQNPTITLEDALSVAKQNYASMERDRLNISYYQKLSNTGLPMPPSQISISGDELGASDAANLHSLNFQQNFYLPKVSKAQQSYFKKGVTVAEKQLILTEKELEWRVKKAYYQLIFAKEAQALVTENIALFKDFLAVATTQLETGETGKIPQLAARTRLGQAELEAEHAAEKYNVALLLFNQWLRSDVPYEAAGQLQENLINEHIDVLANSPHLQVFQAQKEMASSAIELEKSKRLPQLVMGTRLQTASGNFPLFGYQVGMNVPLFKKNYQGRIDAAEIGIKIQEAAMQTEQQKLERTVIELQYRLKHQYHILEYLREDLQPLVEEQSRLNWAAYREGEINYLEYLNSLEEGIKVKQQYLEALFELNILQIEMEYWQ